MVLRQPLLNLRVRCAGLDQAPAELRAKADSGAGLQVAAVHVPAATGVDGQSVDIPSAYVTLLSNGEKIGSYLVSVYLDSPQTVSVNGKAYEIALRFKRSYKPYTLHLIDFAHDNALILILAAVAIVILLEWKAARSSHLLRWRKYAVGTAVFLINTAVLIGLGSLLLIAAIAAPALADL